MNIYQENILDHYRHPRHYGALESATKVHEELNPMCGDRLKLYLRLSGHSLEEIQFEGEGCAISIAAASMLTEMIEGKSLDELQKLRDDDVLAEIGVPLPPARTKCALLAISGLRKSLSSHETIT